MNFNRFIFGLGFVLGTGAGAFTTYMLINKRNQEKLNARLNELTDQFTSSITNNAIKEIKEKHETKTREKETTAAAPETDGTGYINYQQYYSNTKPTTSKDTEDLFVPIDEDEFGQNDCETITRYTDGIFADDLYREITDPEHVLGKGAVDYFEEGDTDTIWVRNVTKGKDYEIVFEERTFDEARPRPYPT